MWKNKRSWRSFKVVSLDLPRMTEKNWGEALEITGFAVKF